MRVKKQGNQRVPLGNSRSAHWVRGLPLSHAGDMERALAIFQPDILIPDRFLSTYVKRLYLAPEKFLMLAVLHDAVSCYQVNLGATEDKKRQLFLETNAWIMDEDPSYLYSFENICDSLGLAPAYLRRGLMSWKARTIRQREQRSVSPVNPRLRIISKEVDSAWA